MLLRKLLEGIASGNAPFVRFVIVSEELVEYLLSHLVRQGFHEKRPPPVDDGNIFCALVVPCGQADGDVGPIDAVPASVPRIHIPLCGARSTGVQVVEPDDVLHNCLVQPRLVHLIVAHHIVEPLVPHLVGRGSFKEDLGRQARHLSLRIIQIKCHAHDARILYAQCLHWRTYRVKLRVGIGAESVIEALQGIYRVPESQLRSVSSLLECVAIDHRLTHGIAHHRVQIACGEIEIARRSRGEGHSLLVAHLLAADLDAGRDHRQ